MVRKKVSPGEPTEFTKPVFDQFDFHYSYLISSLLMMKVRQFCKNINGNL